MRKSAADLFVRDDVAAMGWPVVGNLRGKNMDQIESILMNRYKYSKNHAANAAGQLLALRDRVKEGNTVFAYQCNNTVARVGKVIEEYKFNESNDLGDPQGPFKYPQQIRMEWRDRPRVPFDRSLLPDLQEWLARRGTIVFCDYDLDALEAALRRIP